MDRAVGTTLEYPKSTTLFTKVPYLPTPTFERCDGSSILQSTALPRLSQSQVQTNCTDRL